MNHTLTLSLILFTLISGCSKTDNHDANSTTPAQEQSALQAPVVENAPESTTNSSVTVTVRTLPNCEVYLQELHVATSDSEGVAYITLELGEAGSTQTFSFKVKANNHFSESVVVNIARLSAENNNTSSASSVTSQSTSSINAQSSQSSSAAVVVVTTSSSAAVSSQGYHVSSSASTSSTTTTGSEASSSTPAVPANPLTTLTLTADTLELAEGNTTSLHVKATYKDTTTKPLTTNLQWSSDDPAKASITETTLKALKEGDITLHVSQNTIQSNPLHVTIYKEINGHRLPPEPDETLNNSTLLGIDSNNNGVRDDVERWIYETYKDKHPIHIDIAMQEARADKRILETPEKAKEIHDEVDKAVYCQLYYRLNAKYFNEPILLEENVANEYFRSKVYFNTQERMDAYLQYDSLLSGDSYTLPSFEKRKAACDFNTSKYRE